MRLLVIGGSDAGTAAALRARELDADADVTVLVADRYPNFSICGLPFLLSEEVKDHRDLAHRTVEEIEGHGIRLELDTRATAIDAEQRRVHVESGERLPYDALVVATGAEPARPSLPGLDLPGVLTLHTMDHAFAVERHLRSRAPRTAIVIGAGYIGTEMADALSLRGLEVTLVEQAPAPLPTVDPSLGRLVERELARHGVDVRGGVTVDSLARDGDGIRVSGTPRFDERADLVLLVTGVRPDAELAMEAGARHGPRGALTVTRRMETNLPGVWAAGDCVETWHRLLERPTYLPLGTTAHKQGRVAGENAVGGDREFAGSVGTQVVKVFDLAVAGTGLRDPLAREAGFDPLTVEAILPDHKRYYPGAHELTIRVTGDQRTGRLLGAQIAGHHGGQVAKRIDVFATALHLGLPVDALSDLDLSYTPPLGAPWDPVQAAAQAWTAHARDARILEAA